MGCQTLLGKSTETGFLYAFLTKELVTTSVRVFAAAIVGSPKRSPWPLPVLQREGYGAG